MDTTPVCRSKANGFERTTSRHSSLKDTGVTYPVKYRATTLWYNIICHFRDEMPVKRHRRQLTSFENSFTGKEAVDFLLILLPRLIFEGRQVDRSNCVTLLQKFLDQGLIERVRSNPSEKAVFKDNSALYVFVDDCRMLGMSKTPRLVRTNSCCENPHRAQTSAARLPSVQSFMSPSSSNCLMIQTHVAQKGFNRRLSSSHGNLLALLPQIETDSDAADSLAETIDSKCVEVNFEMRPSPVEKGNFPSVSNMQLSSRDPLNKDKNKSPSSVCDSVPTSSIIHHEKESAYEWLNFARKKKPSTEHKRAASNLRTSKVLEETDGEFSELHGHRKNDCKTVKYCMSDQTYCPIKVVNRYVTEVDVWSIWKSCLLSRLSRLLSLTSLPFITWKVDGQDVKWNCQRIGNNGVVKSRTNREDFSGFLLRLMRYLEQFPFPSGSANIITYKDKQEVNVFRTVCSLFSQEPSILTNAEACALTHVVSLFHENRSSSDLHRDACDIRIETEFSANLPSSRRLELAVPSDASSRASQAEYYGPMSLSSNNEISDETRFLAPDREDWLHADIPSTLDRTSGKGAGQVRNNTYLLEELPEYDEILKLPGLKKSPDLMKKLDELCLKNGSSRKISSVVPSESMELPDLSELCKNQCDYGTNSPKVSMRGYVKSSLDRGILSRPSSSLLEALSLVLLSLPSARRRKLHRLVRFMNRIATNHCLQLDELLSNREAVLKGLSKCIVPLRGYPPVTSSQRHHIVTILLDYERKVFGVPKGLILEVEDAIRERQREKVMPVEQDEVKEPTTGLNTAQYFDSIKIPQGNNQHLNQNLLELLEQICCDENLSMSQKQKRLKKFKKAYPAVYSQKFPSPEVTQSRKKSKEGGLFSRLLGR
ncbi:hypothetical protein V3C99_012011 [Haemonchus contortus]